MNRRYGNAQTIGKNFNQNTYFLTKQKNENFLVLVADGTIDSINGAYAAILACETLAKSFDWEQPVSVQMEKQFHHAAQVIQERIYRGKQPRVSLLAAYFSENSMYFRRVGTITIASYDEKNIKLLQGESGTYELKKEPILIANQGVWQAMNEIELEQIWASLRHPYEDPHPYAMAQKMIEEVNLKNRKEQKSTVIVLVE